MPRLRDRLFPWIVVAVGAYLLLLLVLFVLLQPEEVADLQVLAVAPTRSTLGEDLPLRVSGTGFGPQTRLILSPDLGNEAALLATIPSWSRLQGVALDGPLAYLASGYRGVQVMNVSRPERPVLVGSVRTPGTAWKIVLKGELAFLAAKEGGVQIIDIADPHHLRIIAGISIGGNAVDLVVRGDRAYVANSLIGLQLIDVADPAHPRLIGAVRIPGAASAVAVRGGYAFLADARQAVHVLAIGKGKPASIVATVPVPDILLGIAVSGNFAYATGRRGVHVIDIRDPDRPRLAATVPTTHVARGIALEGGRAYVATDGGLLVFDLAVPADPRLIGLYRTPGTNQALELDERQQLAYICNGTRGLTVVDVSDPRLPPAKGGVDLPSTVNDYEQGEEVLFAVGQGGMFAVNPDHPERPSVIGSLAFEPPPLKVALAENRAYLMVGKDRDSTVGSGIQIVDTTDPRQLQPRGFLPLAKSPGSCTLAAAGNLLFVGTQGEIRIFDAGEAARPQQIGSLATPGEIVALLPDGPRLYAGDGTAGLLIIDISAPPEPRLLGSTALPWHLQAYSRPKRIAKAGNTVLIADGRNGMLIYEVAAARPRLVASVPTDGFAGDLTIAGDLAFVLADTEVLAVDIHDPRQPRITGVIPAVDKSGKISVHNGWIFTLNGERDLTVLPAPITARKLELHSATELSAVFPAPATPGTYSLHVVDGLRTTVFPGAVTVDRAPGTGHWALGEGK